MLKMDVVSGFEKGRGSVLNLNFFLLDSRGWLICWKNIVKLYGSQSENPLGFIAP